MFLGPTVSSFRSSSSWPWSATPCLYLRPCSAHLYLLFVYICTSRFTFPFQTSRHKPFRKKINISKMIGSFTLSQELQVHVLGFCCVFFVCLFVFCFLGFFFGQKQDFFSREKFLVNKATFNLYSGVYRIKKWQPDPPLQIKIPLLKTPNTPD